MNISPVSFGRTVKINAPLKVAQRMSELINQNRSVQDREERTSQQKLKTLFYDANVGSAQAVEVDEGIYIVSGEDSQAVSDLKLDTGIHINAAKNAYGDSEDFAKIKEEEIKRCNEYLNLIVQMNKEAISIFPKYGYETSKPICDRVKIKSINVVL
ncbi:MAG: hypothetical protein IJY61_08700 [Candidatus Gastranaerophilales bacterium]|nr:hypothetical protein [Candidatus Gastranaerophilales bacterium]